eukprot:2561174-Amphidinium_carterae.2
MPLNSVKTPRSLRLNQPTENTTNTHFNHTTEWQNILDGNKNVWLTITITVKYIMMVSIGEQGSQFKKQLAEQIKILEAKVAAMKKMTTAVSSSEGHNN